MPLTLTFAKAHDVTTISGFLDPYIPYVHTTQSPADGNVISAVPFISVVRTEPSASAGSEEYLWP